MAKEKYFVKFVTNYLVVGKISILSLERIESEK